MTLSITSGVASLGVEVFTITVGSTSHFATMQEYASPHASTHAFHSPTYDELERLSGALTEFGCPPVLPLPCEMPVDLVFVLDSSGSVGAGNWNIMKQVPLQQRAPLRSPPASSLPT